MPDPADLEALCKKHAHDALAVLNGTAAASKPTRWPCSARRAAGYLRDERSRMRKRAADLGDAAALKQAELVERRRKAAARQLASGEHGLAEAAATLATDDADILLQGHQALSFDTEVLYRLTRIRACGGYLMWTRRVRASIRSGIQASARAGRRAQGQRGARRVLGSLVRPRRVSPPSAAPTLGCARQKPRTDSPESPARSRSRGDDGGGDGSGGDGDRSRSRDGWQLTVPTNTPVERALAVEAR